MPLAPDFNQNALPVQGPIYKVFVKDTWSPSSEWTERTDLRLIDIQDGANRITKARIQHFSGSIMLEGETAYTDVEPIDIDELKAKFIKIEVYERTDEDEIGELIERWIVRAAYEEREYVKPKGSDAEDTTDQRIVCFGLEKELDSKIVTGSFVWGNNPNTTDTDEEDRVFYKIGVPMVFNEPKFGTLKGYKNRGGPSTETGMDVDVYNTSSQALDTISAAYDRTKIKVAAFAIENDGTKEFWTIGQAIQYLLTFYGPDLTEAAPWPVNPEGCYQLDGLDMMREAIAFNDSILKQISDSKCPPFSPEGRSIFECLNALLRPERGVGWKLVYGTDANGSARGPQIAVFATNTAATSVGSSIIEASTRTQDIDLSDRWDIDGFTTTSTSETDYGQVIARGAHILSCFSMSVDDGSLDRGWTDADEEEYNNPPSAPTSGDNMWEKIDDARQQLKAYSEFVPKEGWNWKAKNGEGSGTAVLVNPIGIDATNTIIEKCSDRMRNHLRFESFIPIEDAIVSRIGEDLVPEYMRPKVFVKWTDEIGTLGWHDMGITTTPSAPRASISALNDKLGLRVETSPKHQLAITRPTNVSEGDYKRLAPWNKLIMTAAMRTSRRVERSWIISGGDPNRTLYIEVPNAELWIIAPNTPYKVNGNRELVRWDTRVVRNDGDKLAEIAGCAGLWYGSVHRDVQVSFSSLRFENVEPTIPLNEVGNVVESVVWGTTTVEVNTVISARYFNFIKHQSVFSTGFGPMNFSALA